MIDWSKIFNIAFVAGAGVLALFLLVSTIAVAVKGKRKCNAFDVILRIVSTLVFAASTVMFAAAVLCMLSGPVRIATEPAPTLFFNDFTYVLPIPDLFVLLSTTIGSEIAIVLFLFSLVTLIVDCLVANKKSDKKKAKQPAVKKTPEQLKREAELDRIRRIGESAVKKTNEAARAAEAQQSQQQPQRPEEVVGVAEEPAADWRDKREEKPAEFVGLASDSDTEFDSFDSFDEQPDEAEDEQPEEIVEEAENEQPEEIVEEAEDERPEEIVEDIEDERPEEVVEDIEDERPEEVVEEAEDEQPEEIVEEAEDEQPEEIVEDIEDEQPEEIVEDIEDEQPEEEPRVAAYKDDGYDDIAPDRDIYIPEIRTINKQTDDDPELKPSKKATPKKSGSSGSRASSKSGTKKPAAKKTSSTARKSSSGGAARKPAASGTRKPTSSRSATPRRRDTAAMEVPEEKKLPVTRRYVILDRRNAVNMFGEYLRERNKAEKEKLQSSINTIIIE